MKTFISQLVVISFLLLSACGGGSGGGTTPSSSSSSSSSSTSSSSSSGSADNNAPGASIIFPPSRSLTSGDSVIVRGSATDAEGSEITMVRVNGVDASSSDLFATWQATVPLIPGDNTLTVETVDIALNTDTAAASALIKQQELLSTPSGMVLDNSVTPARALVADWSLAAVVAVDLATGARTILSDNTTPNTVAPFGNPVGITLDNSVTPARALVVDMTINAVVAVDLATGARTIFSDSNTPDTTTPFGNPAAITLDSSANPARALVVDDTLNAVMAVDLTTGTRTILSDNNTPNTDTPFHWPGRITLDSSVTPARALVVDDNFFGPSAVVAVDLATGTRTIHSDNNTPDSATPFSRPIPITLDSSIVPARALVADQDLDTVVAVDLVTGTRTLLSDNNTPDTTTPFGTPAAITLDKSVSPARALVVDWDLKAVMAVNLATGARTMLSDNTTPDTTTPFLRPLAITLDNSITPARALVVDRDLKAVMAVNLATGARTILSDNNTPDTTTPFNFPFDITLDNSVSPARVLVVDSDFVSPAVLAVDLATGARSTLSDNSTPDTTTPFSSPEAITLDDSVSPARALVVDSGLNAVVAVDFATGARMIISDNNTPDTTTPFSLPSSISLDKSVSPARALVVDSGYRRVVAVDLASGARTIFSDHNTPDTSTPFTNPVAITMESSAPNRALVLDSSLGAVVAVDLINGQRVILSK